MTGNATRRELSVQRLRFALAAAALPLCAAASGGFTAAPSCSSPGLLHLPYCDAANSRDQRVADILSRLSDDQKVSRLVNDP